MKARSSAPKTTEVHFHSVPSDEGSLFEVRGGVDVNVARAFARNAFIAIKAQLDEAVAGEALDGDLAHICALTLDAAIAADAAAWEGAGFTVD